MKPRLELFTDIAREHLFIETLEERQSDSLDFHDVSVWGVKNALLHAYQAGLRAGNAPQPMILLQDISLAMHEGGMRKPKGWLERIDRTIAEVTGASSPPAEPAAVLPIVTVTVRGGLIEDMDATSPVHVIVADWDVPDEERLEACRRTVRTEGGEAPPPDRQ
jgi:hypothetical protein